MTGALAALISGGPAAQAVSASPSGYALYPADAYAYIEYRNDGTVHTGETPSGDTTLSTRWLLSGPASAFDIRLTGTGDTPAGSGINVWSNLGADQSWTLTMTMQGNLNFNGTIEIRRAGGAIISSAAVSLDATSDI